MKPASSRSSAEAQQESQTIEIRRNDNQKAHTLQGQPTWSSADRGAAAGWTGSSSPDTVSVHKCQVSGCWRDLC